ncbi:CDP-alcohol phosphatidyltransferase family protein [Acetatifactor muris]|jgi:CDP-diacylglycerol--serine O-phosphatidyltransferase|uniref:CDP-alcohol phosphatidyltransferase family protein n=1 Tax=Acetatifactor muris TaxID=879566 RepID=UPI0023F240DB|nr:CDP-alcohol phosphatidyltransferase family protein [Acetatifactor muris]MCI8800645.1 CDP-diacylglycerol--serine O-phosphatidyltransferase [Lachnospiraceae bacterium]
MIGFYNYTVILTYISFISAVAGIFSAAAMQLRWAIFFLAFSGFCDMFDGKIARMKKDRTEDEKSFGIQIDSLCDMVCFGALPIIICYRLGMDRIYGMAILALYGLAGLIRLGYFNVMEAKRQAEDGGARKYYQGLPITSMAIALPVLFVISPLFPSHFAFVVALHIVVGLVGFLFVLNFKVRKPSVKQVLLIVGVVAFAVAVIVFAWRSWWELVNSRG